MQPYMGLGNSLQTAQGGSGGGAGGPSGGWVELGRTTLGSEADTISVSSLANKRYYMFLFNDLTAGTRTGAGLRFNSDTGTNYAHRVSDVGNSDVTAINRTSIGIRNNSYGYDDGFAVGYVSNLTAKEKLLISHFGGEGAYPSISTKIAPRRQETVGKWADTSSSIDEFTMINGESGGYHTGTEMVVLGWDPSDSHSTNFWEELASVSASGSTTGMSSGTFTAKKYLWVQGYVSGSDNARDAQVFVGNGTVDTGTNYSFRLSGDGGSTDYTTTGQDKYNPMGANDTNARFINMFIINNAASEKIILSHMIYGKAAGSGNTVSRGEGVGKWENESNQINIISIDVNVSNMHTNSFLKVWGSD
jgi:hypothetical protein